MDPSYNQEHMNFDIASDVGPAYPYLQERFGPSTPQHVDDTSAPHHDFHNHGTNGYDPFMSDVMPHGAHYDGYHRPMTPESTPQSIESNDAQFHVAVGGSHQYTANMQEEEPEYPPDFWKTLVDFEIPDFTQTSINNIPGIQALYVAYLYRYEPLSTTTNATRMQYAKALAFALLTHYYPPSHDYTVMPISPGPVAKNGMNFILAADDKSDIWKEFHKNKGRAFRRKVPTKKELERAEKEDQDAKGAEYAHGITQIFNLQWDFIAPEDIAAFVVMRKTIATNTETGAVTHEQHPYTCLAIMIDNFDEVPHLSTSNMMHRSDILTDALCRGGKIQNGHGMLLYGPRLEFYAFDRGNEWVYLDDEEESEQATQDVEPKMEVLLSGGQSLEMDLRTTGLDMVDVAFRDVAVREVVYTAEPEGLAAEHADSANGEDDMEEY
ncbi:hypothetical protein J4E91_007261 [Alternaria rosae]|nr:hypothetical protein J4E91_007261 [Alternaria rosae]